MTPSSERGWVVDASVAVKLLVEEADSALAAAAIGHGRLVAPELLATEVANTLWKLHRRGVLTAAGAAHRLGRLAPLLEPLLPVAPLLPGAMARAIRLGHPVYDCLYLEASAASGLPLLTADRRLAALGDAPGPGGAEVVLLTTPLV